MQKSKLLLNVLFLTLLTSSASSLFATGEAEALLSNKGKSCNFSFNCLRGKLPSTTTSLIGGALASWYLLYSRESVTDFQSRFDRDALLNVKNAVSKDYWRNVWYLVYDEFIGQAHKSKSIKLDAEGENRLQVRKGDCLPAGVCGNIDSMFKTFMKSTESVRNLLVATALVKQANLINFIQGGKAEQKALNLKSELN